MVDFGALQQGFFLLFSGNNIMFIVLGVFYGIMTGALPGLTINTAIAILVPLTFGMEPTAALIFLACIYMAAMYGGSITAILINTPGHPGSACTGFDGHPMTKQGEAGRALGLALGASVIGGTFSYVFLMLAMYPIAFFAIKFGPPEMFLLAIMGLSIIAGLGRGNFLKAFLAGLVGILISSFGVAPTGTIRAHLGTPWLLNGAPTIPTMIGLLAFSEVLSMSVEQPGSKPAEKYISKRIGGQGVVKGMLESLKYRKTSLIGSAIGTFVGAVPAAGGSIAAFLAYNQAKQTAKNPESFGTGNPEGIVAPETANSASTGGALATTLAFGIPGGPSAAVIMSAMMLHGLIPGPRLFIDQMPMVYALILALFLSQPIMIIIGTVFSQAISGIANVQAKILAPTVAVLCIIGSFAVRGSLFDVGFMIALGIIGFFMKKSGYPAFAMVLGLLLGPMSDTNIIRTALRFDYDFSVFLTRPISLAIIVLIVILVLFPLIRKKIGNSGSI